MTAPRGALRILDANANRAREGLRVAEDYARFVLESPALGGRLKALRHDLRGALDALGRAAGGEAGLRAARDTAGDVGTALQTAGEGTRRDPAEVARAGLKRAGEALRALEEYGKLLDAAAAARCEALRYRLYDVEPLLLAAPERRRRLAEALLYVLVTEELASADAATACREAVAGGADIIQMREKELEDAAFHRRAAALAEICRAGGALFLINDRPHIALLTGADGIHTGQGDLPLHLCRRLLGPDRLIGRSTHDPEQLAAAAREGADYAGVGPVYETATKAHRGAVGLGYVRHAAAQAELPAFCIGAVNRDTLGEVLDAGARAVAVCTAVIGAPDIAAEAAWFKARLAERRPPA
jgi:thiamine-phosphate pyrophosphorylase